MIVTTRQFGKLLAEAFMRQPNCENKVMLFTIDNGSPQGIELDFHAFETSDKMCVAVFRFRKPDRSPKGFTGGKKVLSGDGSPQD